MNRVSSHLAAPLPISPPAFVDSKPPLKTEAAFVCFTFDPTARLDGWQPSSPEDAPRTISRRDCKRGRRFHTLPECMGHVLDHNRNRWSAFADTARLPDSWAMVAWTCAGSKLLGEAFPRQVTPLEYFAMRIIPSPTWKPAGLLDMPWGFWSEETCRDGIDRFSTLDAAVQDAIETNAAWGVRRKVCPVWCVVVGAEEAVVSDQDTLSINSGLCGLRHTTTTRRLHVVDASWPLSDATRALILKGGESL